jgi:hypothetical protein
MKSTHAFLSLILFTNAQVLFAQAPNFAQTPLTPSDPANHALPAQGAEPAPWLSGPASDCPTARPHENACCYWVDAEYLLWWVKDAHVADALVSTGAVNDFHTQVFFGGQDVDFGAFSGGRVTAGGWFDDFHVFGWELRGFVLSQQTRSFTFSSNGLGFPPLGIPFSNNDLHVQDFFDVAIPFQTVGRIDIALSSQMWGAEANLLFNIHRGECCSFDLLGGYRYLGLREVLQIKTATGALPGQAVFFDALTFGPPAVISTVDRFSANTDFQSAQLGAHVQWRFGSFALDVTGKVALGDSFTATNVSGASSLQIGPAIPSHTTQGGLLALPSNIGHVSNDDDFAVVPAVEAKLSWQLSRHVSLFASLDCLYWSRVVRASQQVNTIVSAVQVPTSIEFGFPPIQQPVQPQRNLINGDFWAEGVGFGIEFQF